MQITRTNVQELMQYAEDLIENLEVAKEAAETWDGLQDEEPKTEEVRDEIRTAREELEGAIQEIDASSLCQLLHGKHKK